MTASILNFGSINIDHVYQVEHFVRPGETLASNSLSTGLGGKGANQSVAVALAGGQIRHLGSVNASDTWAVERLANLGVDTQHINQVDDASGHAIIQVNQQGENAILLHGGANQSITREQLNQAFSSNHDCEYLLMQNECALLNDGFQLAREFGFKIVLNPAPMSEIIHTLPLADLDTLIVNEIEAEQLSGQTELEAQITALKSKAPDTRIIVTLGKRGAALVDGDERIDQAAEAVDVVDTTGAGDTFVGYFLASVCAGDSNAQALQRACKAAAITTTRAGAIDAIPRAADVD